ncbi:MAG: hypothetical protein Tsb0015_04040 [Simkaniaceae bacterium]
MQQETANALKDKLKKIEDILFCLKASKDEEEKITFLSALPQVKEFFQHRTDLENGFFLKSKQLHVLFLSLLAIGQGPSLFGLKPFPKQIENIFGLLEDLKHVDAFYSHLGGIIGYQKLVLKLLSEETQKESKVQFLPPEAIDISKPVFEVREAAFYGIMQLDRMAEIYPVGGAGDRLNLMNAEGKPLPAAKLPFLGKTLLENLVQDLQAREFLHYKLFGVQLTTPVALMTSEEKNNSDYIFEICQENQYFGRSKDSFYFFSQPLVPVFTKEGDWCMDSPESLLCKPGGHGVIWKLASDQEVFQWLRSFSRSKVLVRQINNPIAGCDYGLAAFTGIGLKHDMAFGFCSCPRRVHAKEGVNVLKYNIETKQPILTCIEYCDFKKYQLEDAPSEENGKYSVFPSNTNILFGDLEALEIASGQMPYPNLIINFKMGQYQDLSGKKMHGDLARIESTMQNIAEAKVFNERGATYLTYNKREKTISAVKKHKTEENSLLETIEGGFFDYLKNAAALLGMHCNFLLPGASFETEDEIRNPPFLFIYHPSLGPFYSIIAQKLKNGEITKGSELQLEITEIFADNLQVDGSLLIKAHQVMGHYDQNLLVYSENTGKCILENVSVKNKGIDYLADNIFWKNQIKRLESLTISLEGNSLFIAKNVCFSGNEKIIVPHGKKMTACQEEGKVVYHLEDLAPEEKILWEYDVDEDFNFCLQRKI